MSAAFAALRDWWERVFDPALRRTALLAIAMLKRDEAIHYLLAVVSEGATMHARDALQALSLYRHDDKLRAQVEAALSKREDRSLQKFLAETFDDSADDA